jgi:hypothetical protein
VLAEDVEDEPGTVDDPHLLTEDLLEVPGLARGELVVEEDVGGFLRGQDILELLRLARADPGGRVGAGDFLGGDSHHLEAGGDGQLPELFKGVLYRPRRGLALELDAD